MFRVKLLLGFLFIEFHVNNFRSTQLFLKEKSSVVFTHKKVVFTQSLFFIAGTANDKKYKNVHQLYNFQAGKTSKLHFLGKHMNKSR